MIGQRLEPRAVLIDETKIDGTTLDAWRGYKSDTVPSGWRIENGAMTKDGSLNNFKLLEYELGSPDFEGKVKASKFADYPHYGRAKRGHIALQGDHEGMLAFRNARVRELN